MSKSAVTQHWNKTHPGPMPGTITPPDQLSNEDLLEIAQSELNSAIFEFCQKEGSEDEVDESSNSGSHSPTQIDTLPQSEGKGSRIKHPTVNGV
jgi:hypothetical protein